MLIRWLKRNLWVIVSFLIGAIILSLVVNQEAFVDLVLFASLVVIAGCSAAALIREWNKIPNKYGYEFSPNNQDRVEYSSASDTKATISWLDGFINRTNHE